MNLHSLRLSVKSDMGMTRKLENICQDLTRPAEQGEVVRFLANTENAQRINSLVEDICEAMMDYQVCMGSCSFSTISDLYQTSLRQDIYNKSCQLIVSLTSLPSVLTG